MGLCFVPDCDHTNKHGCKMFRFPLDSAIKKKWESLIRRADRTATKFSLVCSCHFVEGKKENCPTIFNRNKDKMFKYSSSEKRKRKNIQKEAVAQENTARFSTSPPTQAAKRANEEPSSKEINPTISKSLPILEAEKLLSDLYVGNTSDKKNVQSCGVLDNLEAGDLVLADKGLLILDLLPARVSLNIPQFLINAQFNVEETQQTKVTAQACIHVERTIRRMKLFKILTLIPNQIRPYSSKIFQVVGCLTNLNYPLLKEIQSDY